MEQELLEEQYRTVNVGNQVDYRKLRATDVKSVKRVFIPKPLGEQAEEEILTRGALVMKVIREFTVNNAVKDNLTASERRGIVKLQRRAKAGEIVILETDKSGKFAVCDLETYEQMGKEHVKNDVKVSWECVTKAQSQIKGHLQCLNKVFRTGEALGEKQSKRAKESKESTNSADKYFEVNFQYATLCSS